MFYFCLHNVFKSIEFLTIQYFNMQAETNQALLQQPIHQLLISEDFKQMAAVNGFETMDAVLSFPLTSLMHCPGFTPRVLQALTQWLQEHGLMHLLRHQ